MTTQGNTASNPGTNGHSTVGETLYALTDEQILDIDDAEVATPSRTATAQQGVILSEGREASGTKDQRTGVTSFEDQRSGSGASGSAAERANRGMDSSGPSAPRNDQQTRAANESPVTGHETPPEWLAQAMNDPQRGGEAHQFWESAQQARAQAAQLASLDQAYFGVRDAAPAERAASREALAQQLLREDPAAFREMLAAGLRALEQGGVILSERRGASATKDPRADSRATVSERTGASIRDRTSERGNRAVDSSGRQAGSQNDHPIRVGDESPVTNHSQLNTPRSSAPRTTTSTARCVQKSRVSSNALCPPRITSPRARRASGSRAWCIPKWKPHSARTARSANRLRSFCARVRSTRERARKSCG